MQREFSVYFWFIYGEAHSLQFLLVYTNVYNQTRTDLALKKHASLETRRLTIKNFAAIPLDGDQHHQTFDPVSRDR